MESCKSSNAPESSDGATDLPYSHSPTWDELELNFSTKVDDPIELPKTNVSLTPALTEKDIDLELLIENDDDLATAKMATLGSRMWNGTRIGPPTLEEVQLSMGWSRQDYWSKLNFGFTFEELEGVSHRMQDDFTPVFIRSTRLLNVAGKFDGHCQNYQPGHVIKEVGPENILSSLSYLHRQQLRGKELPDGNFRLPHLYSIFRFCLWSKLVDCKNKQCIELRTKMFRFFPETESEWPSFREWAIVRTSCLISSGIMLSDSYRDEGPRDHAVISLRRFTRCGPDRFPKFYDLTIEVYELIQWMYETEIFMYDSLPPLGLDDIGSQDEPQIPNPPYRVYEAKTREALEQGKRLGICPNRLWNVVSGCMRAEFELVCLMTAIYNVPTRVRFAHQESTKFVSAASPVNPAISTGNHKACTSDLCHYASIDSTGVETLHMHTDQMQACTKLDFSKPSGSPPYIWSVGKPERNLGKVQYIAISHVWSDGTGSEKGNVNECILQFFQQLASDLKYQYLWWDSISIPTDPKLRAEALQEMHLNFKEAELTVVHSLYTANYPWRDDGTPCIALALSSWFTRGWTALELIVSKRVLVIFKNPDPNDSRNYVLKDLDTEVLASKPGFSRGHWIASTVIRRLRNTNISSMSDLLQILETRSTSWPRDRLAIASLLCNIPPDVKHPDMQAITTRQIVSHFGKIDPSFLMHGGPTESEDGLFSWCLSTLLFGTKSYISAQSSPTEPLNIFSDGSIVGEFHVKVLSREDDAKALRPFTTHRYSNWKIQCALSDWRHYMVIWPYSASAAGDPALLVKVLSLNKISIRHWTREIQQRIILDCRMEGVVYGADCEARSRATIRLGKKIDNPSTKFAVNLYESWNLLMNNWEKMFTASQVIPW